MTITRSNMMTTVAALAVVVLAAQYPLSSTMPMGNDTTRFLLRADEVLQDWAHSPRAGLSTILTNSQYPGSLAVVAAGRAQNIPPVPLFMWLMATAQISAGGALWWWLRRFGVDVAAFGLFGWALTPLLHHAYINGMLAILLSFTPFMLALIFFAERRLWLTVLMIMLTGVAHPMAIAVLLPVLSLAWLHVWLSNKPPEHAQSWQAMGMIFAAFDMLLLIYLWLKWGFVIPWDLDPHVVSLPRLMITPFLPYLLLAPIGFALVCATLSEKVKQRDAGLLIILAWLSSLLTFSNFIGLATQVRRFESFFLISTIALSAIALARLMRHYQSRFALCVVAFLMIVGATVAWQHNAATYASFENPTNYARVHPDELAAIYWIGEKTHNKDLIYTVSGNRHDEWLPILTGRAWDQLAVTEDGQLARDEFGKLVLPRHETRVLVVFTALFSVNELPAEIRSRTVVFQNELVTMYDMRNPI